MHAEDTVSFESRSEKRMQRPTMAETESKAWTFSLRHMIYLVFYSALACWLIALVAAPVVVVSLLVIGAIAVGTAVLVARRKSTQQDALIEVMAIAAERGMSLGPAIQAFSDQCHGRLRRKLRRVAADLAEGIAFPETLDRWPGVLPRDVEVFARIGWATGMLAGALASPPFTGSPSAPYGRRSPGGSSTWSF